MNGAGCESLTANPTAYLRNIVETASVSRSIAFWCRNEGYLRHDARSGEVR
jgi:hypothetical protein